METLSNILPILLPFTLMNIGFIIYAVIDIANPNREVIALNKTWWIIMVICIPFAWVIYLLAGRTVV